MKDITPRGPYKSHTAGMSAREAAEWFAKEAQHNGGPVTPEITYLNAGTPSCVDHERVHEEKRRTRETGWYKQVTSNGVLRHVK